MRFHRVGGDAEAGGDLLVDETVSEKGEDLALPIAQTVLTIGAPPVGCLPVGALSDLWRRESHRRWAEPRHWKSRRPPPRNPHSPSAPRASDERSFSDDATIAMRVIVARRYYAARCESCPLDELLDSDAGTATPSPLTTMLFDSNEPSLGVDSGRRSCPAPAGHRDDPARSFRPIAGDGVQDAHRSESRIPSGCPCANTSSPGRRVPDREARAAAR